MPLVLRVARDVRRMFAPHLDIRDLAQAGNVGLVKAAQAYDPGVGAFEPYAYFRIRGAIIDSQKRRVYREEGHVSLQAIAQANGGWLPRSLELDRRAPAADEAAQRAELERKLAHAIRLLPPIERHILTSQLQGRSLAATAADVGRSLTWTRARLAEAREAVGRAVRGR